VCDQFLERFEIHGARHEIVADDERRCAADAEGFCQDTVALDGRLPLWPAQVPIEPRHIQSGILRNVEELLFGEIVFRRQQGLMKCPVFALQV